MIFYRWGNWGLYSLPALLLTHDIPPKPTVCMGSTPKQRIHLDYVLPPGYHISSLFHFTSCLPVSSRLVLSFWLSLAFLKHLLTSYKWQQILFLWFTPLCWLAGFLLWLSLFLVTWDKHFLMQRQSIGPSGSVFTFRVWVASLSEACTSPG